MEGHRVAVPGGKIEHATSSPSPDFAKMWRFVDGQTFSEEQQQQTQVEHLQELSGPEKTLECREGERLLQVQEEVPEKGERRAQVAEPWVVDRQEAY